MAGRLHDVSTQAIHREDFVIHGALPPAGVGGSPPLTLEEEPRGCQEGATWVNLTPFGQEPGLICKTHQLASTALAPGPTGAHASLTLVGSETGSRPLLPCGTTNLVEIHRELSVR